jgi:hypothetical protein
VPDLVFGMQRFLGVNRGSMAESAVNWIYYQSPWSMVWDGCYLDGQWWTVSTINSQAIAYSGSGQWERTRYAQYNEWNPAND